MRNEKNFSAAAIAMAIAGGVPETPAVAAPTTPHAAAEAANTPKAIPGASFCYTVRVKGSDGEPAGIKKAVLKPHRVKHHTGVGVSHHPKKHRPKASHAAAGFEQAATQDRSVLVCNDTLPLEFPKPNMNDLTQFMPNINLLERQSDFSSVMNTPLYPKTDLKDPSSWNWGPPGGFWIGDDFIAVAPSAGGPGGGGGGGNPPGGGGGGGGIINPPAGIPEPATWAQLIAGFGVAGAALRMRRRAAEGANGADELNASTDRGRS